MKTAHVLLCILMSFAWQLCTSQEGGQNALTFLQNKYNQGIDFYAIGNEPFWAMDIDYEGELKLTTLDGIEIIGTSIRDTSSRNSNVTKFTTRDKDYEVNVKFLKKDCSDTMSENRFFNSVKVDYRKKGDDDFSTLVGCGNQVPDLKLHNTWIILSVNGKKLNEIDFMKGEPKITIDVIKNKISGNDGCNNLFGGFQYEKGVLIFQHLAGTMMACPNLKISNEISKSLSNKKLNYKMEDNQLSLYYDDSIVMTLQKANESEK